MIVKVNVFLCNLLLSIIVLYFSQGVLYAEGSIIGKVLLFILLTLSSVYLIKSLLLIIKKSSFFYFWLILLLLNACGYILVFELSTDSIYFAQFKSILLAIIVYYPFYYFGYRGALNDKKLKIFFFALLTVSTVSFYIHHQSMISNSLETDIKLVDNIAYFFVALLPYIFLWNKNKKISFILLLFILFMIIQASKRGALICAVIFFVIFSLFQLKNTRPEHRLKGTILSLLALTVLTYSFYRIYLNNTYLIDRMVAASEGEGSGRDKIYTTLYNNWYYSDSLINQLFGFGFVSTVDYSGSDHLAHNDWLELLTNFGLLGVFIYLIVILSLLKYIFFNTFPNYQKAIIISIAMIWIMKTLFSMYYTNELTVFASVLLGYYMGFNQQNKNANC